MEYHPLWNIANHRSPCLHLLLADIIAGADAMMLQNSSNGGEKIAHALENYANYFDYPGWRGLK